MTATPERRSNRRIPVEMWVEEVRGRDYYFQRSGNLSVGGMYLDKSIPHPRGTTVQLKFTLPDETEPICVDGEIVGEPEVERLGMHVRFTNLEADSLVHERVIAFVARRE